MVYLFIYLFISFQTQKHHDQLTQSKDKAQLAATTAMSVVNVALLRDILDQGPDRNHYYYFSAVLICVAIFLQVLAGMLTLWVSSKLTQARKYASYVIRTRRKSCCCPSQSTEARSRRMTASMEVTEAKSSSIENEKYPLNATQDSYEIGTDEDICCCCCFDVHTINFYSPEKIYEYIKAVRAQLLDSQMKAQEAKRDVAALTAEIDNLTKRIADLKAAQQPPDEGTRAEIQKLEGELDTAHRKKAESEKVLRESGTLADQQHLLSEVAGSLRKQSLMMSIARWQDFITYIMYAVFVLHAFVVAFGVASGEQFISPSMTPAAVNNNITHP